MFLYSPQKNSSSFFFGCGFLKATKKNFWYEKVNQGKSDVGDSFLVFPDLCFSGAIHVMDDKSWISLSERIKHTHTHTTPEN